MNKTPLTEKQKALLIWMAEFKNTMQRSATMQEIAEHFKVSISAISVRLDSISRRKITY